MTITIAQAFAQFKELTIDADHSDVVMMSEDWSNYTDGLTKDGELTSLQYQHAPSYDDPMPDDDREFILEAMGVTMTAERVQRRPNMKVWDTGASHWKVMIKRGSVWSFYTHYSMGSALPAEPDLCDVMHSLLTDIQCDPDFEDFCNDIGYDVEDEDSRALFNAINKIRVKMAAMFTYSEHDDLTTLFEDY
jgi:hypothetical protein